MKTLDLGSAIVFFAHNTSIFGGEEAAAEFVAALFQENPQEVFRRIQAQNGLTVCDAIYKTIDHEVSTSSEE